MIINPFVFSAAYTAETLLWISRATALGASPITSDIDILNDFSAALALESYSSKIIWTACYVGSTIAEHRVPLRDTRNVGAMSSLGSSPFVNSDCSTATGISNPTEKDAYLSTLIANNNLNLVDGTAGGLGHLELNWGNGTNVEPIGAYSGSNRYCIDLRPTFQRGRWGNPTGSQAGPATTAGNHHYYFQCDGTNTEMYIDGSLATPTGSGPTSGSGDAIFVMGCNQATDVPWKGQSGIDYLTDGTMSASDVAAFKSFVDTYIRTATGR